MPQIYIDSTALEVDIEAELTSFDWHRATWSADKLIAQSPFRPDSTPSFYVYLRDTATAHAGNWGDSGTGERGGFVALLARLRNELESATTEYLRAEYGAAGPTDSEGKPRWQPVQLREAIARPRPLPESALDHIRPAPVPYLTARGISEEVQRLYGVGQATGTAVFPWRLPNGKLASIMNRAIVGKAFWYAKGGMDIRGLVYGIDVAYRECWRQAALVEAPIDALTCATYGVPALAIGGASFNAEKAEVIAMSPVDSVIIIADNDEAGERWRAEAERLLRGKVRTVYNARVPAPSKDVNEALMEKAVNPTNYVERKSLVGGVLRRLGGG